MQSPLVTVFLLVICSTNGLVSGQRSIDPNNPLAVNAAENVDQFWANLTSTVYGYIQGQSREVLRQWNDAIVRGNLKSTVSEECFSVIEHIIRHPLEEAWSAKIIDSMNTRPAGLLSGTTTEFGDFDQCLSVDGSFRQQPFVGKYCLATVNLPRTELFTNLAVKQSILKYAWLNETLEAWNNNDNYYSVASALCFPSLCKTEEIRHILLAYYPVLNSLEFNVTYCQSREEPRQFDSRIWIALLLLALPWFFIIPGTLYEFIAGPANPSNSLVAQSLLSFSLLSNTRVLFRIVDRKSLGSNDVFQFVHGLRAIASLFIIIAHTSGLVLVTYQMRVSLLAHHPDDMIASSKLPLTQPFYNGALIVLTFFLLSGFFLSFFTASARRLKLSFGQYVILRWLRYTPPLIGMLCLTLSLELIGSGPAFHHDLLWPTLKHCYNGWLSHLFFYSNYKGMDETCGIQTWYISVEMQLHILAFIYLLAYVRSPRLAFWVAVSFIGLGMVLVVAMVASGLSSIPLVQITAYTQFPIPSEATQYIFFAPTMNMIPYFMGVILGQLLLEKRSLQLSPTVTRLIWLVTSFIFLTFPMASLAKVGDIEAIPPNRTVANAIVFSVTLLLWSLANGWLVWQCVTCPSIPVARFLSAQFFQPFSRLSFSLYLCHVMTIWYNAFQTRKTITIGTSFTELYKNVSLSIIQSFILAYLLYVSFEAPSVNIIKMLMNVQTGNAKQKKSNKVENEREIEDLNNNNNNNNNNKSGKLSRGNSKEYETIEEIRNENTKKKRQ